MAMLLRNPALVVAFVLLLLAISLLVVAYDYTGGSGLFPRFTGWIFVALALMETLLQLKNALKDGPVADEATGLGEAADSGGHGTVYKEIKGFLWMGLFLGMIYLGGFLAGIPLYIFIFLRLSAGRKLWECAVYAVSATIFVYILFIVLLEYRLYPGIVFGG